MGDLENTISNSNIENAIDEICIRYSNPFIVSVDAALSRNEENVGKIIVSRGRNLPWKRTW